MRSHQGVLFLFFFFDDRVEKKEITCISETYSQLGNENLAESSRLKKFFLLALAE